jgi:iron(III) transport system ATP-binding protein
MDEPLSNLDAKLRVEMRNAIKSIQQKVGITTVYVTHDQEEALAVSDRIAVMNDGVIQQVGTPKHIYQRPYNRFVSHFIGLSNFFDAKLTKVNGMPAVDFGGYAEAMSNIDTTILGDEWENAPVMVAVRPEEFAVAKDGEGLEATVLSSVFLGISTHYFMRLADGKDVEVITPSDANAILPDGAKVKLRVLPQRINVFTADGSRTLIADDEDGEPA